MIEDSYTGCMLVALGTYGLQGLLVTMAFILPLRHLREINSYILDIALVRNLYV